MIHDSGHEQRIVTIIIIVDCKQLLNVGVLTLVIPVVGVPLNVRSSLPFNIFIRVHNSHDTL